MSVAGAILGEHLRIRSRSARAGYGIVYGGHSIPAHVNSTGTTGVGGATVYPNAYPKLAWSFLDPSVQYANVAVPGDTIQQQIDRFATDAAPLLAARSNLLKNAYAIRIGVNDFWASVPLATMKTKLLQLINLAFTAGANRVFVETESPRGWTTSTPTAATWEASREGAGSFNEYIRSLPGTDSRIVVIDTNNPAKTMGTPGAQHNDTVHYVGSGDDTHPLDPGMLLYAYDVRDALLADGFPQRVAATRKAINAPFSGADGTLLADYAPTSGARFFTPRGAGFKISSNAMICHTPSPLTDGPGTWGVASLGGGGDMQVQADLYFTGNISSGPALLLGVNTSPTKFTETQNGEAYAVYYTGEGNGHVWLLRYTNGGGGTQIATGNVPSGSGLHNFRAVRSGNNIKVYVDGSGTPAIDFTDSSPLGANNGCGIMGFLTTTPISNFSAQ